MLREWLLAFALTQVVEMPIYASALRGRPDGRLGPQRASRWIVAFSASALTHPVVWFVFPRFSWGYWRTALVAETFAIVVEAAWLRLFGLRRALAWSVLANTASFSIALVVWLVVVGLF
jgi:hypothetical protein